VLMGAVLTRVAASHLRVGTFQYAAKMGVENVRALADYTLERHYPDADISDNRYLVLLREVIRSQAELIAKWQLIGFIHGVMNTDNMALSGETIDYGPCAFMDAYDPATVFSSIDTQGRYAYGNQPYIGAWNLARLAETLLPLLHDNEEQAVQIAEDALKPYSELFHASWLAGMRAKLGLFNEEKDDEILIKDLLNLMEKNNADYTNTFRALTFGHENTALDGTEKYAEWRKRWQERLERQQQSKDSSLELMRSSNPAVIPRNHRVEEALEAAVEHGDYSVMERLLTALANPYAHSPEQEQYCSPAAPTDMPYQTFCGT